MTDHSIHHPSADQVSSASPTTLTADQLARCRVAIASINPGRAWLVFPPHVDQITLVIDRKQVMRNPANGSMVELQRDDAAGDEPENDRLRHALRDDIPKIEKIMPLAELAPSAVERLVVVGQSF